MAGRPWGGRSHDAEYNVWRFMIRRCTCADHPRWNRYGGRGIKVCERWATSYEKFLSDVGRRPTPQHSIDRIDNDGNYEPGNVRWATRVEQAANQKRPHARRTLTFNGRTLSTREWASEIGITHQAIESRIDVSGWSVEEAVTIPKGGSRSRL